DPRRPVVAALAIAGGRVVATGSRAEVRRWRDRRTRVVSLRGATVVPGLVDAHAHLDREGLKTIYPSLARCRSIADVQTVIRRALALAGITRGTIAPKGVEIVKDAAGEPTGLFVEQNLLQVLEFTLMKAVPRFTHADRLRALRESQRRYAMRGVTAVYEGHGIAPEVLSVYREAHAAGELALRCTLAVS